MSKSKINKETGIPNRVKNLIGERYGRLLIIKFIKLNENNRSVWECLCECGNTKVLTWDALRNSKSCGCLQKEIASIRNTKDITGNRYGNLVAIEIQDKQKNNSCYTWKCECDCGNTAYINTGSLQSGNTKSCGCISTNRISELGKSKKLPNDMGSINTLFGKYKISAKKRNISFNLSKENFIELIKKDCYYCGDIPSRVFTQHNCSTNVTYNGIDRVDNKIGYEVNNCVPCCTICNTMKMQQTEKEFYNKITKIYNKKNDRVTDILTQNQIKV